MQLFKTHTENRYYMIAENFWNGNNFFEVYVDRDDNIIHIYDDIEKDTAGTSAINLISPEFAEELCRQVNILFSDKIVFAIYCTGEWKITTYGYSSEDKYDFNIIKINSVYKPFEEKMHK